MISEDRDRKLIAANRPKWLKKFRATESLAEFLEALPNILDQSRTTFFKESSLFARQRKTSFSERMREHHYMPFEFNELHLRRRYS
ncbi:hypothetical protein VARIO8X_150019 [Burkholderiales bacterium 8X]|nr:hypothetical protein VARIO8X_150019 [Burkholderiales bacterium 8X]